MAAHGRGFLMVLAGLSARAEDIIVDINAPNCGVFSDGTEEFPFCSIQQGLDAAALAEEGSIKVFPGVYQERIVLRPDVSIEAVKEEDFDEIVVEYTPAAGKSPYVITGADNADIEGLIIRVPAGATLPAVLLYIPNVRMVVEEVYFDGGLNRDTTGVLVSGPGSSHSRLKECTFTHLEVGVEAVDTSVRITRNLFTELIRDAIYVHAPESGAGPFEVPEIGTANTLELSDSTSSAMWGGFVEPENKQIINTGNAFILRNTTGQTLYAQLNDWDVFDSASIAARLSTDPPLAKAAGTPNEDKQVEPFVFEPFLGKSVFPGEFMCASKMRSTVRPYSMRRPGSISPVSIPESFRISTLPASYFPSPSLHQPPTRCAQRPRATSHRMPALSCSRARSKPVKSFWTPQRSSC